MRSHCIWKLEDMQMITTVRTAQKRSQNSTSSGAWEHMINENFLHWERLLQPLASKTSRLCTPEPYYEIWAKQTGEVGLRILCLYVTCMLLAYWTAWLPVFLLFTFLHQYIHIQNQKLGSVACSMDQILREQLALQLLRGIAWVNTGELLSVDITPYRNWCKKELGCICSHWWAYICIYHFALLTGESFLSNYAAWQAVQFSELRKTRPAHKQSLLTSTGPCTRLRLSHLDFVLMSTKPLAVTQMELTEYSPYF